jgi:hypothetical protein
MPANNFTNGTFRIEQDSLGPVKIPSNQLRGRGRNVPWSFSTSAET